MQTLTRVSHFNVCAPPAQVFPLLCPVLEYRWIPHWRCELLHSASGVAEEDCVFRTDFPDGGDMTWVVSRFEPPVRIEFTCYAPEIGVHRLKIALTAEGAGTRLEWTRRWLPTGPQGEAWISEWSDDEQSRRMDHLRQLLDHYLATGHMLPP